MHRLSRIRNFVLVYHTFPSLVVFWYNTKTSERTNLTIIKHKLKAERGHREVEARQSCNGENVYLGSEPQLFQTRTVFFRGMTKVFTYWVWETFQFKV